MHGEAIVLPWLTTKMGEVERKRKEGCEMGRTETPKFVRSFNVLGRSLSFWGA